MTNNHHAQGLTDKIIKITLELSEESVRVCKKRMKELDLPFKDLTNYVAYLVLDDCMKVEPDNTIQKESKK